MNETINAISIIFAVPQVSTTISTLFIYSGSCLCFDKLLSAGGNYIAGDIEMQPIFIQCTPVFHHFLFVVCFKIFLNNNIKIFIYV